MMKAHTIHADMKLGQGLEDLISVDRMRPHNFEFVICQPTHLVEDGLGDGDLSDIMQDPRDIEVFEETGRELRRPVLDHAPSDIDRIIGHTLGVATGVLVFGLDGGRKRNRGADKQIVIFLGLMLKVIEQLGIPDSHGRVRRQSGKKVQLLLIELGAIVLPSQE